MIDSSNLLSVAVIKRTTALSLTDCSLVYRSQSVIQGSPRQQPGGRNAACLLALHGGSTARNGPSLQLAIRKMLTQTCSQADRCNPSIRIPSLQVDNQEQSSQSTTWVYHIVAGAYVSANSFILKSPFSSCGHDLEWPYLSFSREPPALNTVVDYISTQLMPHDGDGIQTHKALREILHPSHSSLSTFLKIYHRRLVWMVSEQF